MRKPRRRAGEPMMRDLIIYGASYPDIIKLIDAINADQPTWNIKGFIDDTPTKAGSEFMGFPVLGGREVIAGQDPDTFYFNNVYATTVARRHVADVLAEMDCRLATLVHPAVDTKYATIGAGTIIPDGVILGTNVSIGRHCAIRYNSLVNHDSVLEDFVFVGPGVNLSGHVTLRAGAYIGVASVIKERVTVGTNSTVGAGAVVIHDVPPETTVVGIPAKNIREDLYAND